MIVIDATADGSLMSDDRPPRRFNSGNLRGDIAGAAGYAVIAADLPRLRDDLDREFQRLQARLAA